MYILIILSLNTKWSCILEELRETVLRIRRGNSGNLGIVSHISPQKHIL